MKLSVLLPTRNRLELLISAIETVRRQSVQDWELVISDNASDQDIRGHVDSLADERIRYHRTDRFVPVTDNWNAALERSTGDYIVMLGDDDGLLPGYIEAIAQLVDRFDGPDVIYTSALLLTFPGVTPEHPDGYVMDYGLAPFLQDVHEPYLLGRDVALAMAHGAMNFRLTFGFNSQFLVVSRRFVASLAAHGPFYQSPFPDYYSSIVAMLEARSIVVEPRQRVVIGVSPKSYGFFTTNKRDEEGRAFLAAGDAETDPALAGVMLPGSNINIGWLASMEAIAREYGVEHRLSVNHARFRRLQIAYVYEQHLQGRVGAEEIADFESRLRPVERAWALVARGAGGALPLRVRRHANHLLIRSLGQFPAWYPPRDEGRYRSILDVFEANA